MAIGLYINRYIMIFINDMIKNNASFETCLLDRIFCGSTHYFCTYIVGW